MNRSQTKIKRRKISPVDIVIAVIFIVALLSMIYLAVTLFTDDGNSSVNAGVSADCTLKIENVDIERYGITLNEVTGSVECAFLQAGDQVYDPQSGEAVGRITAVTYELATASSGEVDEEGNLIYVEYPGYVNLILTLRTEFASEQDRTVGSLGLQLGRTIHLQTASYEAAAEVIGMEMGVN